MLTDKYKLGMLLFIASEASFFILLILAYVSFHRNFGNGKEAAEHLDILTTGFFSIFLLSSSLTVWRAEVALHSKQIVRGLAWLGVTILFGAIFLVGQGREYAGLIEKNVTISRDLFGTTFFTLTGFHGLHVFLGLIMLSIVTGLGLFSQPKEIPDAAFESVALYWHFVDVVWIFIFAIVYLWGVI